LGWFKRLRNKLELARYRPPCRGCLLLTACTMKNEDCIKLNMAVIHYMQDKYPNLCAYCGGKIIGTGETRWFDGSIPPTLCSVYRCNTCTFNYGVGSVW